MFDWIGAVILLVFFLVFASLYIWGIFMMKADTKIMLDQAERSGGKPLPDDLKHAISH